MATTRPFDDIRALIASLPEADDAARAAARARAASLISPPGALGRLEEIAVHVAAWQGRTPPTVSRPLVAIFAASHGVAAHGVSALPPEAGRVLLDGFAQDRAAVNQVCKTFDIGLKVFDLALNLPTGDMTCGPALEENACAATIAFGMEAVANGTDLLCVAEAGIGGGVAAAAISAALFGGEVEGWVEREPGTDEATHARKVAAVKAALATHAGQLDDPLEVLRRLGGREIAAICGAILAARMEHVPVILDGYAASTAAAVLHALWPRAIEHCLAGQVAAGAAHRAQLARLGLVPVLDLAIAQGEGVGAALAAGVVRAALACHAGTAPGPEAGHA